MTNYVQIVQHLRPGGIESLSLDLATLSFDQGRNWIISLEGDKETALAAWPKLHAFADKLIFLEKAQGRDLRLIFKLKRLLKYLEADVVQTHHIGPLLYGGCAARLANIKTLIHTEHDVWHLNSSHQAGMQRALLHTLEPIVVADAQVVAEVLSEKLGVEQINVIRNGIDTERFTLGDQNQARIKLGLPANVPLIGCSGRLVAVKDHATLLRAIAQLPATVHLALAGSGPLLAELQAQAGELQLTQRVHFLGHLDNMPDFYQAIDLFCLPSLQEGFPLSPLEAQSCGKAVVLTDVGAAKETLAPNNGLLVPPADPTQLAQALAQQLQQTEHIACPREFVVTSASLVQMRQHYYALFSQGQADAA